MEEVKPKVRIFDSAFTPFSKSASLREENKDVHPTHFEWDVQDINDSPMPYDGIFTDGLLGHAFDDVGWLIEPRHLRPENYEYVERRLALFTHILTYDKELLDKYPDKALFYPFGGSSIAFDRWGMYEKTKDICMFVSDKNTTEGHKLRHKIAEEFGDRIDLYGAGVGKPVDSKFEVLKDYKYCVVVESGYAHGYFSEKIVDALSVGCIPIYWGCPNIDDFFEDAGIFTLVKEPRFVCSRLHDLLEYISHPWFEKHTVFEDVSLNSEENVKNAKKYRICEDWIYTHYPFLFEANND